MEDQSRDWINNIKQQLRQRESADLLRDKECVGDRDILAKGLDRFWTDLNNVMGELCERMSREVPIELECRSEENQLIVLRPNTAYSLTSKLGKAPPYEVDIAGNGFTFVATVRILVDATGVDWLATLDQSPTTPRQAAHKALGALILAR